MKPETNSNISCIEICDKLVHCLPVKETNSNISCIEILPEQLLPTQENTTNSNITKTSHTQNGHRTLKIQYFS